MDGLYDVSTTTRRIIAGQVVQTIIYITAGLLITLITFLVIVCILGSSRLRARNELTIICGYMLADGIYGFGYLSSGFHRLILLANEINQKVKPLDCMKRVHTTSFIIGAEAMTILLLAISIDRLICVMAGSAYSNLRRQYFITMALLPFAFAMGSAAVAWGLSATAMPTDAIAEPTCIMASAVPKSFYLFHNVVQVFASSASVAIYGIVMLTFFRRSKLQSSASEHKSVQKIQTRRQQKITRTLGLMSLCTLLIYVLPQLTILVIGFHTQVSGRMIDVIIPSMRCMTACYSLINILIYVYRSHEVRRQLSVIGNRLTCGRIKVSPAAHVCGQTTIRRKDDDFCAGNDVVL